MTLRLKVSNEFLEHEIDQMCVKNDLQHLITDNNLLETYKAPKYVSM